MLAPLRAGHIPWTKSSIRPAALAVVVNDIVLNRRRTVVEFGAGVSTEILARLIRQRGGRLVSFEDNADWIAILRQRLADAGDADAVKLVHAPLAPGALRGHDKDWYDASVVTDSLKDLEAGVDLVLVDGPAAHLASLSLARYPDYPVIRPNLGETAAIYLDDINRPGERAVLRQWAAEFDGEVMIKYMGGDYAVMKSRTGFHTGL